MQQQSQAPEDAGRVAVGEAAGDGRGERERHRPGCHEQPGFHRSCGRGAGSRTAATRARVICAVNEHTEVAIDSVKIGRRSRSNGMSGAARGSSWRTSSQPSSDPRGDLRQREPRRRVMRERLQAAQGEPKGAGVQQRAAVVQGRGAALVSGRALSAMAMVMMPSGTLMPNSQRQCATASIAEAIVGPRAAAVATTKALMPMARPRWRCG